MINVLLLTATVAPRPGTKALYISNPDERISAYCEALEFYLSELSAGTFSHIIFAENSGYDLAPLRQLALDANVEHNVSFVHVDAKLDQLNSRFSLELELISNASRLSPFSLLDNNARIWKITGRYIVRNVGAIVRSAPKKVDACFHSRHFPTRWTEFYIAAFNREALKKVLLDGFSAFKNADNGEEVLWDRLNNHLPAGIVVSQRFRILPSLVGIRAWDGRSYTDLRGRVGRIVRSLLNRVLPFLWI